MPTPTRYREIEIGDGDYACVENNKRNAQRGTFVVQGGELTPGTSSSQIVLNIDATEFRADAENYNLNDGQVTLPENSTPYPRRDLITAEIPQSGGSPNYDVKPGDPIDSETMQSLVAEGRVEQDGTPIYPVMAIPQVQPPPGQGLLNQGTVLGMAYVPGGVTDSTDTTAEYLTDLRMSGIAGDDVLYVGDALAEVENKEGNLDVTAANSAAIGGVDLAGLSNIRHITLPQETLAADEKGNPVPFHTPSGGYDLVAYAVQTRTFGHPEGLGYRIVGDNFDISSANTGAKRSRLDDPIETYDDGKNWRAVQLWNNTDYQQEYSATVVVRVHR